MSISVAVVGATGNVGREILNILSDRKFPVSRIAALASRKSVGTEISFGDELLKVKDLETFDFKTGMLHYLRLVLKPQNNMQLRLQKMVVL